MTEKEVNNTLSRDGWISNGRHGTKRRWRHTLASYTDSQFIKDLKKKVPGFSFKLPWMTTKQALSTDLTEALKNKVSKLQKEAVKCL